MENAIWIKETGEEKHILIKDITDELGENGVRKEKYRCPHEVCGVKMVPVFPKKKRLGEEEVHTDHFRAEPSHAEDCPQKTGRVKKTPGDIVDAKPSHAVVEQHDYPVRYDQPSQSGQSTVEIVGDVDESDEGGLREPTEPKVKDIRRDLHRSEPRTKFIRKMVIAYEKRAPKERSKMKIVLPGCRARSYKSAFVNIDRLKSNKSGIYIYYGAYLECSIRSGIAIYFSKVARNRKRLGVWIKPGLGPKAQWAELEERLVRAQNEKKATIYAFGRFQPFRDWKYSIEVKSLSDLWITFPGDSGE